MLATSARVLRLLSLLQSYCNWSGADLAERLGVSTRTVRRDVERLRELGYPVHAIQGTAGYRLGAGAALPPLLLDDDEAVAVSVGLRTATASSIAGIEETSLRALTKLEQVLPSRLRHRVRTLQQATVRVGVPGPRVDADTLMAVAETCRRHERCSRRGNRHTATSPRTSPISCRRPSGRGVRPYGCLSPPRRLPTTFGPGWARWRPSMTAAA